MESRYQRHINLAGVGTAGQRRLSRARVLVVGAGGLGCPALQYLTAAGVGHITIVDPDKVSLSNLQRQVLYGTGDIGTYKAETAARVLRHLNDTIKVVPRTEAFSEANGIALCRDHDIIVDCTDNYTARYLINDACVLTDKPWVYAGIYQYEGQVAVFNHDNGPTYRCLFPSPPPGGKLTNCTQTGVLGVLAGIIGSLQANEVIKWILGIGDLLSGRVACYHSRTNRLTVMRLVPDDTARDRVRQRGCLVAEVSPTCAADYLLSPDRALAIGNALWLDVRRPDERPLLTGDDVHRHALDELDQYTPPAGRPIITFCRSGRRAATAASLLRARGFNAYAVDADIFDIMTRRRAQQNQAENA